MATYTSIRSGSTSDTNPATNPWGNAVLPTVGDKVNIANTHTVTVDNTITWGDDTSTAVNILAGGTLKASRTANSQLTIRGEFTRADNSIFDYGTNSDPIPTSITAKILLGDSAVPALVKWGGISSNGSITHINGASKKTNTTMNSATAGATSITVADATGWKAGDKLALFPTERSTATASRGEEVIIAGGYVGGTTIPLTTPLIYPHTQNCPLSNVTKNVIIASANTTTRSYFQIMYGSLNSTGELSLSNIAFDNLGDGANGTTYKWGANITSAGIGAASAQGICAYARELVFYHAITTSGTRTCFSSHASTQRINIEDSAFVALGTSGCQGIYEANGTVFDFTRCNVLSGGQAISTAYSEGGKNCRHYNCNIAVGGGNMCYGSVGMAGLFSSCKFMGRGYLSTSSTVPGLYFKECDIGHTFPLFLDASVTSQVMNLQYNHLGDVTIENCNIGTNLYIANRLNTKDALDSYRIYVKNKDNNPIVHEQYQKTGQLERDNTIYNGSPSSIKLASYIATTPHVYSLPVPASNNETVTLNGYVRTNTSYGTAIPLTVTLSGLGITPVVWTAPTTVETWNKFTITATPTSGLDGNLSLEVSGRSANITTSNFWLSGVIVAPYITSNRHYGYLFDNSVKQTVNQYITETDEAIVSAYTGIAIDHTTNTITLSSNHSIQEIYDYVYYNLTLNANLGEPEYFTTTDGQTYTTTYSITLSGGDITGSETIVTTGTLTGVPTAKVVDATTVPLNISLKDGSAFNIKTASSPYTTGVTNYSLRAPKSSTLPTALWSLGKAPKYTEISTGILGGDFVIEMTDISEYIDTGLDVSAIIANTTTSVDGTGYHIFFDGTNILTPPMVKATTHQLMGYENYHNAMLALADDSVAQIFEDEIRINIPLFTLELPSGVNRTELQIYINTDNAKVINPSYILNPSNNIGLYVNYIGIPTAIDYAYMKEQVWTNPTRTLTESAGLTTEQAEQLTRVDTTVATNLDKKVSEVSGGGGGFVRNVGLDIQDKKYLKETHEKVMTLANTDITNIEEQLNENYSQIELATEQIIDTIKTSETEICSDVIRKSKDIEASNVKTRQLVMQKTEKINKKLEKDEKDEQEGDEVLELLKEMKEEQDDKEILEFLDDLEAKDIETLLT